MLGLRGEPPLAGLLVAGGSLGGGVVGAVVAVGCVDCVGGATVVEVATAGLDLADRLGDGLAEGVRVGATDP